MNYFSIIHMNLKKWLWQQGHISEMNHGWHRNLLLSLASIITSFFIFEILAQIFIILPSPYPLEDGRLIWDRRGFWLNQPNQFQKFTNKIDFNDAEMRTDSSGLRYVPCRQKKNTNAPRIFIIGDSQTFGFGVSDQDTWVNQLQCLFVKKNLNYNVINLGVSGTNIDQYIARTKMFYGGLRKQDLVIYSITWNDFHTKQAKISKFEESSSCVIKGTNVEGLNYPIFCPPERNRFYGIKTNWRRSLYEATGLYIPSFSSLSAFTTSVVYSSVTANKLIPIIKGLFLRYRETDTLQKVEFDTFESNNYLIRFANEIVRKKTNNVVFAFLPSRISYVTELYDLYSKSGTVFPDQDFLSHFSKKSCEEFSLNCISLFQSLKVDQIGIHEFAHDGHLNKIGSRKVAANIFNYILSNFPIKK